MSLEITGSMPYSIIAINNNNKIPIIWKPRLQDDYYKLKTHPPARDTKL